MTRHTFVRGSLAAITGLTLYASAVPLAAPAHAETATEIVLPATMRTTPRTASLQSAGTSGFLEYRSTATGYGLWWTGYDGSRKPVEGGDRLGPRTQGTYGTASDVVALTGPSQDGGGEQVLLRDMGTGTTETVAIPAGQSYLQTYGRTVLTASSTGGERTQLYLLRNENGSTVQKPVTGFPDGTTFPFFPRGTASGLLVHSYQPDHDAHYAWVDPETGVATALSPQVGNSYTLMGPDYVVSRSSASTVQVYAVGAFDVPTHEIPFPANAANKILGVVGDALVVARRGASSVWSVFALPFDGSGELPLARRANPGPRHPRRRPASRRWGVLPRLRHRQDRGGSRRSALDAPDRGSARRADGDRVARSERRSADDVRVRRRGDAPVQPLAGHGRGPGRGPPHRPGEHHAMRDHERGLRVLPPLMGTGDGRAVYRTWDGKLYVLDRGESLPGTVFASGLDDTHGLLDAAGRYASWRGPTAAGDGLMVADLDTREVVLTREGWLLDTPTAVWGETLWTWSGGTATATEVRSGNAITSFRVGGGCGVRDFQAVGRWVYWSGSCEVPQQGSVAKAFVYDARRKTLVAAPTGRENRLGDGFLVTRGSTSGSLTLTDVASGSAVSRPLAAEAGVWDVDPYTGLVGYVDPDSQDIHIVRSGTPSTDIAVLGAKTEPSVSVLSPSSTWDGTWWLSKPASSWTLVLRNRATGATVRTLTGDAAQDTVRASWNGRTSTGAYVANGTYTWSLTVTPAGGQGAAATASGSLRLTGGAAVRRDHVGSDGIGDLLTLTPSGALTFHQGDGSGKFTTRTTASGWPSSVTAVPFGDLSGDRCDDVLVRLGSGALRAYRPGCGKALTTSTSYTALGTGWNQYDVLTSPGDITGDGRADLIARRASTNDIYLYKATGSGTLSARVRIAKWSGYKKIVGVGDLNGDGYGDLLAQDASNELWRYGGTAAGGFRARVKVADNWGTSYNVVVGVGDITSDGKADIVSRDTSGRLWRNNGDGRGSFGPRTAIATTGWQGYKALY